MSSDEFPSLKEARPTGPHAWIQWKATNVFMEVSCKCGAQLAVGGAYAYHIKCPHCGQVYECGGFIKLHPLDFEPHGTKLCDE